MHLFYIPDISGDVCSLSEEESWHCLKVLRLKKGDLIHLTDGKGNLFSAQITDIGKKHCLVRVTENLTRSPDQIPVSGNQRKFGYRPYRLHIGIAPTKSIDRFEWFLEKATEIGIDEITPLICDRSERRHLKIERLEKVITSAVKQSLKAWHPKLNSPQDLKTFTSVSSTAHNYIAFLSEGVPPLQEIYRKGTDAVILIGPEGDFSHNETEMALGAGYMAVTLGDSRLRTETAGIVACHTLYLINTVSG